MHELRIDEWLQLGDDKMSFEIDHTQSIWKAQLQLGGKPFNTTGRITRKGRGLPDAEMLIPFEAEGYRVTGPGRIVGQMYEFKVVFEKAKANANPEFIKVFPHASMIRITGTFDKDAVSFPDPNFQLDLKLVESIR
ncbi:MAG TPA: hypothetical protein VGM02_06010 [Acidobacteriaceae bacterium]|jgi:hypothetical protein